MENEEFDLAAVVNKLMSDPAALDIVKKLKEESGADTPTGSAEDMTPKQDTQETSAAAGGAGLPPDVSARLPEIVSALSPILKNSERKGGEASAEAEKRNRLLAALKPYLSDGRRGMVDTVMSLSKITNLLDILPKGKP